MSEQGWTTPRRFSDAPCEECDLILVPQRAWNAASPAERREMAADGFVRQGVGQRCSRCHKPAPRRGRYKTRRAA